MRKWSVGIGMCIVFVASTVLSQQLTKEQLEAEQKNADALALNALFSSEKTFELTPERLKKMQQAQEEIDELTAELLLADLLNSAKPRTRTKSLLGTSATLIAASESQESGEGGASLRSYSPPTYTPCTTNLYEQYGVPAFDSGKWLTTSAAGSEYPWTYSTFSLTSTNWTGNRSFVGGKSYPGHALPAHYCMSFIGTIATNHYDAYGDPVDHMLTGFYMYFSGSSSSFKCSVASYPGDNGYAHTNLPVASSDWRHFALKVPAFVNYTPTNPQIMFTTFKQSTDQFLGPDASVVCVQWCPIMPPPATTDDLNIVDDASNNQVRVEWNPYVYRSAYWALEFAGNINGPYSTNIGTAIIVTNNLAYATFSKTNDMRYYRMLHK